MPRRHTDYQSPQPNPPTSLKIAFVCLAQSKEPVSLLGKGERFP
jgi:hypothetical protein